MVDKILLVIGLLVAAAIIITGGFGLLQGDFIGFDLFSSGPRASSPGGWFSGYSAEPPPTDGQIISSGASPTGPAAQPGYSPYEKRVRIQTVVRPSSSSLKPEEEYAFLRNADDSSKPPIVISGWTLENSQGKRYAIAGAQKLALMDVNETSVFLPPGAEAYVHTGPSPINVSFRENACTGYLNENNKFMPRLAERCPRPDVSKFIRFTDRCLDFMERSIIPAVFLRLMRQRRASNTSAVNSLTSISNTAGALMISAPLPIFTKTPGSYIWGGRKSFGGVCTT